MIFLQDHICTEQTAATLDAAVEAALEQFQCSRAEVDIEILSSGGGGFLGVGKKPARVRVTLIDRAFIARYLCRQILQKSGFRAEVEVSPSRDAVELNIVASESARVIGRHGQTLDAVQHLVSTLVDRINQDPLPVVLDCDGYRGRRHSYLKSLAIKLSAKVRTSGTRVSVEPLPTHERKMMHQFIRDQRGVTSKSVGQGHDKRIVVTPEG